MGGRGKGRGGEGRGVTYWERKKSTHKNRQEFKLRVSA